MYLICLPLKATLWGTGFVKSNQLFSQLSQNSDTSQFLNFLSGTDTHTSSSCSLKLSLGSSEAFDLLQISTTILKDALKLI